MINDGLDALRAQLDLSQIMSLIENTAQWVDRKTFQYLPVWYPEEARRDLMYKANWSEPQTNTSRTTGEKVHKRVGNTKANITLTRALGLRTKDRPNWTCCHIWGIDDATYQTPNSIVSDKRFYSCVGNMMLLPTPLKTFTDVMPEVKVMIRIAAAHYYDWMPSHKELPELDNLEKECDWSSYPETWPTKSEANDPIGVTGFNDDIRKFADKRKSAIRSSLAESGEFYPRQEVIEVLKYWRVDDLI